MRTKNRLLRTILTAAMCLTAVSIIAMTLPVSAQDTAAQDVNIEFIFDSSGSMAEEIEPGVRRIDAARTALHDVIDSLPETEGTNVGFRVYGHEGSNTESGRAISCASTELEVPIAGVDKQALHDEVDAYSPVGWTPIALSLRESEIDFPAADTGAENATVLVTDGLETCGGDPCFASRSLKQSPAAITTHVIGFALSTQEQANLQCIVDESGGLLLGAENADELADALFVVLGELDVVQQNGTIEIEEIGGMFPQATITGGAAATDSAPAGEQITVQLTDSNVVEVPAGNYSVSWSNPAGTQTTIEVQVEAEQVTFIRGSVLNLPHGGGETYILAAINGTVIWQAPVEWGNAVWVLPGVYRLRLEELGGTSSLLSMDVQALPGQMTAITVTTAP